MKLVWNAIVKNEAAVIERCVNSLLPHVDGAVIVDTGSTDGTSEKITEMFHAAGKPVQIAFVPFRNFEQARNAALQAARTSPIEWDYLLLADADMELKINRQPWLNGEQGLSYDLKQTSGSLGYYNRRLVSRRATGMYCGVTHEYLDIASNGTIDGAEFIDHADGANRPNKLSRDIALLEEALRTETRPGLVQRYHFYLAGTYFDLGDFNSAAEHYKIRTTLGGFAEECWYAQMRYALCLEKLGDPINHIPELLRAYSMRPQRGETLYELARYYREKGDNFTSLLFSAAGMRLPTPASELLFVNNWIHKHGLREEFAICAYYDPSRRKEGAKVCNDLVLAGSAQARNNQFWYLEPLVKHVPSFTPTQIPFHAEGGLVATNPSVINYRGRLMAVVRTVNYTITPEGVYSVLGSDGSFNRHHPINTRNYLVGFDRDLKLEEAREIHKPANWPDPAFDLVIGFEDSRLFEYDGQLWTSSTVRELSHDGLCQIVAAPLVDTPDGLAYGEDYMVFESHKGTHEKNWMPWVRNGEIQFVYRLGSLISAAGGTGFHRPPGVDVSRISGGSQVVRAEGLNIALVHEAGFIPGRPHNRYYQHRFVTFDNDGGLAMISAPFCFQDRQIEFAAGLAYDFRKRQLIASYGLRDCEAWLATMDIDDVIGFMLEGA